jgi:hypothetical protein
MNAFLDIFDDICSRASPLVFATTDKKKIGELCGRMMTEIKEKNEDFIKNVTVIIANFFKTGALTEEINKRISELYGKLLKMEQSDIIKTAELFQKLRDDYFNPMLAADSFISEPSKQPSSTFSSHSEASSLSPNSTVAHQQTLFHSPSPYDDYLNYSFTDEEVDSFCPKSSQVENPLYFLHKRALDSLQTNYPLDAKKIKRSQLHSQLSYMLEGLNQDKFKNLLKEAAKKDCSHDARCECTSWIGKRLNQFDHEGLTLLHQALKLGQVWAIDIIADYGGDMNITHLDNRLGPCSTLAPLSYVLTLNLTDVIKGKIIEKLLARGAFPDKIFLSKVQFLVDIYGTLSLDSLIQELIAKGIFISQWFQTSPDHLSQIFNWLNRLSYVVAIKCYLNDKPLSAYLEQLKCHLITDVASLKTIIQQSSSDPHFAHMMIDCFYQILGNITQRSSLTDPDEAFAPHLGKLSLRELAFAATWKAKIRAQRFDMGAPLGKIQVKWIEKAYSLTELETWKRNCFTLLAVNSPQV